MVNSPRRRHKLGDLKHDYKLDPWGFCRDVLGERTTVEDVLEGRSLHATAPWESQVEILNSVRDHQRTAVRSGHNLGKTHIAARVGIWFLYSFCPSVVITTAPKFSQVRDLLWVRWRSAWQGANYPLGGELLTTICRPRPDKYPDWFAGGYTAKDANAFSGYHEKKILFILDEADGIPKWIFDALEGMLSGEGCKVLLIGNPLRRTGEFFRAFRDPLYHKIEISCLDHPNVVHQKLIYSRALSPGWPKERLQKWGKEDPRYMSRVLGKPPKEEEGVLIPRHWIEAAIGREVSMVGPSAVGIDVARYGINRTVFFAALDRFVTRLRHYSGQSLMKTAGYATVDARSHLLVGVDDTGVGGGVTDRCEETVDTGNVRPFITGEKASSEEARRDFYDLGSEAAWMLREAFRETFELVESGKEDPNVGIGLDPELDDESGEDDSLIEQLSTRRYQVLSTGQIKLEKKEDYVAREKISPDDADSLIICWWFRGRAIAEDLTGDDLLDEDEREQIGRRELLKGYEDDEDGAGGTISGGLMRAKF